MSYAPTERLAAAYIASATAALEHAKQTSAKVHPQAKLHHVRRALADLIYAMRVLDEQEQLKPTVERKPQ